MERINELLEKYFKGETTLAQENELKQYFTSNKIVEAEHEAYRALFVAFGEEKKETAPISLSGALVPQHKPRRFWIKTFSYSGIAATLLLALWIQRPQQENDYAIINGRRIDDPQYAQEYAEKKLNAVHEMVQNGLKPLRDVEILKKNIRNSHRNSGYKNETIKSDKTQIINN